MIAALAVALGSALAGAHLVHRRRVQRRRDAANWTAYWNDGRQYVGPPQINGRQLRGVRVVHAEERRPRVLLHAERRHETS